jgi:hypothetical protein
MYEGELPVLWPLFSIGRRANWPVKWDAWNHALERHEIDIGSIPPGITDLRTACETVYKDYARRKGAAIWGEKSPNFYDCMNRVAGIFPNPRFIVIWRNPLGVCRSVLRAAQDSPWFSRPGTIQRALLGCERFRRECDRLLERGVPVHQLQYLDLTKDTEGAMRGVCKFLDIPYDARMTSLGGADRSAVYEGNHHKQVRSSSIVPPEMRSEVLPPDFKKKIQKYMRLWREEYGAEWPPPSRLPDQDFGKPSRFEMLWDRAQYRGLRTFDLMVRVAYCFAPLGLWKAYRALKDHRRASPRPPESHPQTTSSR